MAFDLRELYLRDIAADTKNAIVGGPFGSNLVSNDYVEAGVPVIRGKNMGKGKYLDGEFVFVSPEKAQSLKANIARPGDLVFTQRGTLGQVAIAPADLWEKYVVSQSQMKVSVDTSKADVEFLYYYFSSPREIAYMLSNAIQTGVPHTNLTQLKAHPIRLPTLSHQRAIAHILGTLDDKIELNRQMNATLEAMAQALFKSWFVDFDPVIDNALAAGNPIPEPLQARAEIRQALGDKRKPLPADIQKLFPDQFVLTDEMGWVPEGWKQTILGNIVELAYGKALPATKRVAGNIPVYGSGGISGVHNEALVQGPSVVVGRKGTVGSLYWVAGQFFPIDTVFYVKLKMDYLPLYWVFQTLQQIDIKSMGADSAVPGVNRNTLYASRVLLAPVGVLNQYWRYISAMSMKQQLITDESTNLAKLRDTLLPKLLSGELRIPDAEKQLAGAL